MVEKSNNFVFEYDLNHPESPEKGLQAMNFAHCLYIVLVIGKCTDVFRGGFSLVKEVGGCVGGSLHGGRDITVKGVPYFPALFRKQSVFFKQAFSTESKDQH